VQGIRANRLSGGIEHVEKLSPLSESLKPEKPFDDKKNESVEKADWFEIPNWLGGTWRSIQVVETEHSDEVTGARTADTRIVNERERETLGFQLDSQRHIWTISHPLTKFVHISEVEGSKADGTAKKPSVITYTTRDYEPQESASNLVRYKLIDIVVRVRTADNKIDSVERQEIIRKIVLLDADVIAISSDVQIYDQAGFPTVRRKIFELRKREKSFEVVDLVNGTNLHSSFSKFLERGGKMNHLPEAQ
jgi:hypothetical protein